MLRGAWTHAFINYQDDTVFCLDTDCSRPALYCLAGVLHLVKPAIGRKDRNRPVVSHLILWLHYNSSRSSLVKNNRFVFLNPFSITSIF